ncbi:hypothetical protein CEXT_655941 [Caerostris extrusa]|uniref:Uncharacterized protein n=1 Tax=Caerostris extrusa TaxID=172846 RepID=A0AAV4QTP1_CAEEX|nr:hypothetical protein CEXT_655941 [Caerostris extrusa]
MLYPFLLCPAEKGVGALGDRNSDGRVRGPAEGRTGRSSGKRPLMQFGMTMGTGLSRISCHILSLVRRHLLCFVHPQHTAGMAKLNLIKFIFYK